MSTHPPENSLHLWRSRTIDAFARAEATIDLLLIKLNSPSKGDLLSAKIDRLRKAKPSSAVAEKRKAKIDKTLVELTALLPLRNDLVHSPMQIIKDGEHAVACFANPNLQCDYSTFMRQIPAPRMQALEGKVTYLAKALASS